MDQEEYIYEPGPEEELASAKKNIKAGVIGCIVCFLLTVILYHYFTNHKIFLFGAIAIFASLRSGISSLVKYLKLMKLFEDTGNFRKGLVLGILFSIVLGALGVWCLGQFFSIHPKDPVPVPQEQVIQDVMSGVDITIPANFTQTKGKVNWATDSTCLVAFYTTEGQIDSTVIHIGVTTRTDFVKFLKCDLMDYYKTRDSLMYKHKKYDSSVDWGDMTYYKSVGISNDSTAVIIYSTLNYGSLIEVSVFYTHKNEEEDLRMENWTEGWIRNNFTYKIPACLEDSLAVQRSTS